jgi:hypothetical protein
MKIPTPFFLFRNQFHLKNQFQAPPNQFQRGCQASSLKLAQALLHLKLVAEQETRPNFLQLNRRRPRTRFRDRLSRS